ncbi:MAG: hypothetical protein KatS3mg068_0580 [Candidatus Sericytochromatia bacterium]|nr:MAG: hypothetical protein KatS3mg068_0580 [Candidatus Sericytochromatia bacterium]
MIDFLVNDLMLPLLKVFHNVTGSWGWAIVLLTLAIKMALMPLTFQSIRASFEMQKLQPKLKEIQSRYKDRPEIYNKKIMELYQEHKVNPFGGCLPILLQMPFFIGLYSTFIGQEFNKLAVKSDFLFIESLTRVGLSGKDGLYIDNVILVLLFGITMFISQKMMITNPDDPMQKQMLYMMPIMITLMFVIIPIPSGALLYIVVSNIISIFQNIIVLKQKKSLALDSKAVDKSIESNSIKLEKEELVNSSVVSSIKNLEKKSKRVGKKSRNKKK